MSYFLFNLTLKLTLMYYELGITSDKKNKSQHKRQLKQRYNSRTNFHIANPPVTDQCCQYTHITPVRKSN